MAGATDLQLKLQDTKEEIKSLENKLVEEEGKLKGFQDATLKYLDNAPIAAAMRAEANGALERNAEIRARRDQLKQEVETLQFLASIQLPQAKGSEGVGNDQHDAASGSAASRKRPAPVDSLQATAKRFRAYQGNSRISVQDIIYESLPSDKIRVEVKEILNRNDEGSYYARQYWAAEFLQPYFKDGTIVLDHNIRLSNSCELRYKPVYRELFLQRGGWNRIAVQQRQRIVFDNAVGLLSNYTVKSVSHVPIQMHEIAGGNQDKLGPQARLDVLIQCLRSLQMDSAVIGQQTMDILRQVKPAHGTWQLVEALNNTYDKQGMHDVYKVQEDGGEEILRSLCSVDHAVRKRMKTRILQSSLVLAKYTSLATFLTWAVACMFGRGLMLIGPLGRRTISNCEHHKKALQDAWDEFLDVDHPVDVEDCDARYNPDGEIRDKIVEDGSISNDQLKLGHKVEIPNHHGRLQLLEMCQLLD
ncbi:hypothetical protein PG996_009219 [Apiospora saccharicola]|uniref:Uncharacterized protein n=1 Tax=Apiospora saccharicola TaxID=335842 RepID=A0ABR1UK66_9PEZI